ncbi:MAG TPA: NUDIX hydrolase [Candidatus Dormibacteraeota bacterium]|nr:NUDIX hydrolase [Candidatus Dormibacteraeota bacterium]
MALPPEVATHLSLAASPVTPRPSATVVLVRGRRPWELLLVHRPGGADFAPGAYVFPGGTVHEDDRRWDDEIRGAAVRELFEEAGILLARRQRRLAREPDCERVRAAVAAGASFGEALDQLGLAPAFDRLVLLARWVTPAQLRRRFDTRFFLARVPAGQAVRPQEGEVTDWLWSSPEHALASPAITLVYATRTVLESIALDDAARVFARARRMREVPIVEPRVVQTERGWEIVRD